MRQGVIKGIITGIAVLLLAPGAFAATPNDIYRDLADGKLDGTYTQAEMQAFLSSAQVQGYGNPIVVTPTPTPKAPTKAGGVAGDQKTVAGPKIASPKIASPAPQQGAGVAGAVSPSQAPLTQTASAETLPFTGAELGLFAIVGAALLLGGLLLRASARQR